MMKTAVFETADRSYQLINCRLFKALTTWNLQFLLNDEGAFLTSLRHNSLILLKTKNEFYRMSKNSQEASSQGYRIKTDN